MARGRDHDRQRLGQLPHSLSPRPAVGVGAPRRTPWRSGRETSLRFSRSRSSVGGGRALDRRSCAFAHAGFRVEPRVQEPHVHSRPTARARRGSRLRSAPGRRVPRRFSFLPGLPPGIWAMNDNSPSTTLGVLLFVVAHLPDVAVLLRRRFLRAHAVSERRRARFLGESRSSESWCRSIAGWVVVFPAARRGVDLGSDDNVCRHDSSGAGESACAASAGPSR